MSLKLGQVPGAAGSGEKFRAGTIRAQEPKPDWQCECGRMNKGRWTRCLEPGCNERRPR